MRRLWLALVLLLAGACNCGKHPHPPPVDAGPPYDAGPMDIVPPYDAGPPYVDAGPPYVDAGPPYVDAGPPYVDAGPPYVDAGPPYVDAGPPYVDAGPGDAGPPPLCLPSGFCFQNPLPSAFYAESVTGGQLNDLWAVGQLGTIWNGDGLNWTLQVSPTTNDLHYVQFVDTTDAWACGDFGTLLFFDGDTWTVQPFQAIPAAGGPPQAFTTTLRVMGSSESTDVWMADDSGDAFHYDGTQWTQTALATNSPGTIFAVGSKDATDAWLLTSVDLEHWNGTAWTSIAAVPSGGIHGGFVNGDAVWATAGTTVVEWNVTSEQWVTQTLPESFDSAQQLYGIGGPGTEVFVVPESSAKGVLKFDSQEWSVLPPYTGPLLDGNGDAGFTSATTVGNLAAGFWFVTPGGTIPVNWNFEDNSWHNVVQTSADEGNILAGWSANEKTGWTGSSDGTVLQAAPPGWTDVPLQTQNGHAFTGSIVSIWGSSTNDVWAVGNATNSRNGTFFHYNGAAWSDQTGGVTSGTGTSSVLGSQVWGTSSSDVWFFGSAATNGGPGQVTHYDGVSWVTVTPVNIGAYGAGNGLSFVNNVGWLESAGKNMAPDAGDTSNAFGSSAVYEMLYTIGGTGNGEILIAGDNGWIYPPNLMPDAGIALPPVPDWIPDSNLYSMWGTSPDNFWVGGAAVVWHWNGTKWSSTTLIGTAGPVVAMSGTSASNVYALSAGNLFQFDGMSWTQIENTPGTAQNCIWVNGTDVWIGSNSGLILNKKGT